MLIDVMKTHFSFPEIGLGSLRLHGSPRKRQDSSGDSSQHSHLPRSVSESNLTYSRSSATRRRTVHTSRRLNNTVVIPGTNDKIMSSHLIVEPVSCLLLSLTSVVLALFFYRLTLNSAALS
jgi:hypothetical protein